MVSSEVEFVSSSPFGCVLKDRNRREQCRESKAKSAAFQKNLKELVRDHFQSCMSVSADENSENVVKEQGYSRNGQSRNMRLLSNNPNKFNADKRSSDDSSILSSTQSRILERWAASQAQEMVSSIEKQSQEAELLAVASSSSSPSSSSTRRENPQNSPDESEPSREIGNLGASSLVQIWEARLNRSNSMNNNLNPVSSSSTSSSGISNNENVEGHSRECEMGDYVDERYRNLHNHEDSFADWESHSDRTAQSEPPSLSRGRNPDEGESERVRIADIIKKLASANDDNDHEPGTNSCESPARERKHSPGADNGEQREQRNLSQVISSPKIRGRQAFADLLMQLERDRHRELDSLVERQVVSRFSHRGRIQSMLRIRFLQRGMAIQDQKRPQSTVSPVKLSQGSTIMHLREKFSTGLDHGVTAQNDATTSRSSTHKEMANNTVHLQNSSAANRPGEHGHNQEATNAGRRSRALLENSASQTSKDHEKESTSSTDVTQQGMKTETTFLDPQGTSETTTFLNSWGRSGITQDQEVNHRQHISGNSPEKSESTVSFDGENENEMAERQDIDNQQQLYLESCETAETTASLNDWEENELAEEEEETYEQEHFAETNYDWISEISRPRSYWEDLRQTWYREMLSSSSENEEIRQLLERRRVSTFLASDFRETMDQLMTSRVERQTEIEIYQQEEQEEISQERIRQLLLSHLERHMRLTNSQEEEQREQGDQVERVGEQVEQEEEEAEGAEEVEEEEEEDEEDEEQEEEEEEDEKEEEEGRSPISHRFQEASDYFDQSSPSMQTTSPSTVRTWSYHDPQVGDDLDPVVSTSSPQPLPSQAYYQDSRQSSSSTNRLSIETELIYDLRGQIEQLHCEMFELRKSIQSCVDMQVKLQLSSQPEVHPVQGMGNKSFDGALKKRSCCICYEMQVDSLLYRCGHMCTCLKCAHELQWSSGKCPICRAPILDVVRTFMDS